MRTQPHSRREAALKYIRAIRNAKKRGYAYDVYNWMISSQDLPIPEWGSLSYMAAQAVRTQLADLLGEQEQAHQ